ncbi:MAG: hypothetical protein WC821_03615 [archaeon]
MVFDFSKESVKGCVFFVLANQWPLSAKGVFLNVSKSLSKAVSYQAVHKILTEFECEGVITKESGKYMLNIGFVDSQAEFYLTLKNNLAKGKVILPVGKELIFETIYDSDKFLVGLGIALSPSKDEFIAMQWTHFWVPLFVDKEVYKSMKDLIVSSNFYSVTSGESEIDKWCAKFWDDLGIKEKTGVKLGFDISLFIYKDLIVQVFYPAEIRAELDKVYNSTKDPSKLNVKEFFKTVFEKKTRISVLVSRNEFVAKELAEQIKNVF